MDLEVSAGSPIGEAARISRKRCQPGTDVSATEKGEIATDVDGRARHCKRGEDRIVGNRRIERGHLPRRDVELGESCSGLACEVEETAHGENGLSTVCQSQYTAVRVGIKRGWLSGREIKRREEISRYASDRAERPSCIDFGPVLR